MWNGFWWMATRWRIIYYYILLFVKFRTASIGIIQQIVQISISQFLSCLELNWAQNEKWVGLKMKRAKIELFPDIFNSHSECFDLRMSSIISCIRHNLSQPFKTFIYSFHSCSFSFVRCYSLLLGSTRRKENYVSLKMFALNVRVWVRCPLSPFLSRPVF